MKPIVTAQIIERKIYLVRGQKIMLDSDLAELYGVTTKRLNEQVRRNTDRFPADFMFQLSSDEFESLRSHFATSSFAIRKLMIPRDEDKRKIGFLAKESRAIYKTHNYAREN